MMVDKRYIDAFMLKSHLLSCLLLFIVTLELNVESYIKAQ